MRWTECADTDGIASRSILFLLVAAGLVALGIAAFLLRPADSVSQARLPVGATAVPDKVDLLYGVGTPIGWADDHTVVVDGDGRIVALDTDGDTVTILATSERAIGASSLSPDGQTVAYAVDNGGAGGDIFVADIDGSGPRRLASFTDMPMLAWDENSTQIAYGSELGEFLAVSIAGGTPEPTDNSGTQFRDTRQGMTLIREEPVGEWIVAPDGQSLARDSELCSFPMLSPDGRTIACEYRKTAADMGSAVLVELR